jgi:hypothetical protein
MGGSQHTYDLVKPTNDASSTISNLIILTLAKLYEELGNLMLDLHLAKDSSTVICDCDIAVRRDEDFVKTCISSDYQ